MGKIYDPNVRKAICEHFRQLPAEMGEMDARFRKLPFLRLCAGLEMLANENGLTEGETVMALCFVAGQSAPAAFRQIARQICNHMDLLESAALEGEERGEI